MSSSKREKLVTLDLDIRFRTAKALGFAVDEKKDLVWCPERFVEDNGDGTFTMPTWLVEEKGLDPYVVPTRS